MNNVVMFPKPAINRYQFDSTADLTERNFEDRKRIDENKNRKVITILNQAGNKVDAKIEEPELLQGETEGTPINSIVMNEFQNAIKSAKKNAENSFHMSEQAINILEDTYDVVSSTVTLANETKNTLESFQESLQNNKGTVLTENNQFKETYEISLKADKAVVDSIETRTTSLETSLNGLGTRTSTIEAKDILTKVIYDASTNTFIF